MSKIITIVSIFSFLLISCKSNYTRIGHKNANYIPYYLKVYEADSLYLVGDYEQSYQILDSLFKRFEPLSFEGYSEYFTYVGSSVGSNNFKNIRHKVKQSIVKYGATLSNFQQDSLMNIALKKSGYKIDDLESFVAMHERKLNLKLRDTIEMMVKDDQLVRGKNYSNDTKLKEIDEKNMNLIRFIFSNYDYPSNKKIGYSLYNDKDIDLGAVLMHTSVEFKKEYLLNKLLNYVVKGECLPSIYAVVYDRLLLQESNFTGAQLYGEIKSKKMVLIDESKNDSIRRSIGLPSLNYDLWRHNELFGDFFKMEY